MSSSFPISSSEVGDLISALNRLSLALENHLASSSAPGSLPTSSVPASAQSVESPWILVEEEEELPSGYKDERVRRIVEDGPGPVPPALLSLGRSRLTGTDPGSETRVRRAYVAGFLAWAALATNTEYTPADPIGLQDTHFLVLRSWSHNPRVTKLPCRVRTKSDLALIVGNPPGPGSLVQSFASLTEVQIFCGGANIPVPPLLQWRSQKKA